MAKEITMTGGFIDSLKIKEAASLLKQGGLVAIPTETVYGIAAVYNNSKAVQRLCQLKERSQSKPFSLCMADPEKAISFFSILPPFGYRIIEKFWPGPLTVIYYAHDSEEKIGIRIPSHTIAQAILQELNIPVFLPSANKTGSPEAVTAKEVKNAFAQGIDCIVDGGDAFFNRPSTVIDLTYNPFKILRHGVIGPTDLMMRFFRKRIVFVCTGNTCRSPMAEYMLKKFLSVNAPFLLERYEILSRGIMATNSSPASEETLKILVNNEGVDARGHFSQKIDRETILSSDLIFCMEEKHKEDLVAMEPTAAPRIFAIKKFLPAEEEKDVVDPIGRSYSTYEEVHAILQTAISELVEWLA